MSFKRWMDNAFWETEKKDQLNCILEIEDDIGRSTRQVMLLSRLDKEGNPNPDFDEVVGVVGIDVIDKETIDRVERKAAEADEEVQRDVEHKKARKLEKLFNYKLEAFEVDTIKDSTNRKLKAKLRRAKSRIEVDMWSIMILQDSMKDEV